jgi:hypothetical protein
MFNKRDLDRCLVSDKQVAEFLKRPKLVRYWDRATDSDFTVVAFRDQDGNVLVISRNK